jgi:hypothetical protein
VKVDSIEEVRRTIKDRSQPIKSLIIDNSKVRRRVNGTSEPLTQIVINQIVHSSREYKTQLAKQI